MAAVGEGKVGFVDASERMFADVGRSEVGAEGTSAKADFQIPFCPDCSPAVTKVFMDGKRYLRDGRETQRFLCTACGLRFSAQSLKSDSGITSARQICALEAKNLTSATELKTVAGDVKKLPLDAKGFADKVHGLSGAGKLLH